jgi:hypothetical protein
MTRKAEQGMTMGGRVLVGVFAFLTAAFAALGLGIFIYVRYTSTTIDACASHVCLNGGTCISLPSASFRCECAYGFRGVHCELPGCIDNSQFLGNQTVLLEARPVFMLPFVNHSQKVWLVFPSSLQLLDVDSNTIEQRWVSGLNNTRISQLTQHTFYVQGANCTGDSACVVRMTDGYVDAVLTASAIASLTGVSGLFTAMQSNPSDMLVYVTVSSGIYTYLTQWTFDLATGLNSENIWRYANSTDSLFYDLTTSRMYVQKLYRIDWFLANATSVHATFWENSVQFPLATYVQTLTIVSMSVNSGYVWIASQFGNWTDTNAIYLWHFDSLRNPILSASVDLPILADTDVKIYGADSGDLFLSNLYFVARQSCTNEILQCPVCESNAICQSGICQCLYPYFTGRAPSCQDVNECPTTHCGVYVCSNYDGGYSCHTTGAIMPSWWSARAALGLGTISGVPNQNFYYMMTTVCPSCELTTFLSGIQSGYSPVGVAGGDPLFLQTVLFPSPDDREFITLMFLSTFDFSSVTAFPNPFAAYHQTNSELIYAARIISPGTTTLALYNIVTNSVVASLAAFGAQPPTCNDLGLPFTGSVIDMIRPDGNGNVWAVGTNPDVGVEYYLLQLLSEDLATASGCAIIFEPPGSGNLGGCSRYGGGGSLTSNIFWSCDDRYYTNTTAMWHNLPSFTIPIPANTVLTNLTIFTSGDLFVRDNQYSTVNDVVIQSVKQTETGDMLLVYVTGGNTDPVTPGIRSTWELVYTNSALAVKKRIPLITSTTMRGFCTNCNTGGAGTQVYPDYSGNSIGVNSFLMNYWNVDQEGNPNKTHMDIALQYIPIDDDNPCDSNNGQCGNQFCVQTTSGNARCDACQRFSYVRPFNAWQTVLQNTPSFVPTLIYSNPFTTSSTNLFLAGATTAVYYMQTNGHILSTLTLPFVPFAFTMSQDTHGSILYAIASSFARNTNSTLAVSINYLTNTVTRRLYSASMNTTAQNVSLGDPTYSIKGWTIARDRTLWIVACGATSCVLNKRFAVTFAVINAAFLPMSTSNPYSTVSFSYDWKWMIYSNANQFPLRTITLGGIDYVVEFFSQVLGPAYGPNDWVSDLYFTSAIMESTAFGFVGVVVFRNTTEAAWYDVQLYTHTGERSTVIAPFLKTISQNDVWSTATPVQIHFTQWGSLYIVLSGGVLLEVPCAP